MYILRQDCQSGLDVFRHGVERERENGSIGMAED